MAIYKLGELLEIKDNYRSSGYPKPSELIKRGIPFVKTADFNNHTVNKTSDCISKNKFEDLPTKGKIYSGALLISAYGTIDVAMFNMPEGQMSSGVKELNVNEKRLNKNYLFFWLIKNITNMGSQSSVFKQLTINEIKKTKINLPSAETQKEIIDIIEQNENLFLSYPNLVRIDTLEHVKCDMNEIIDIIEPVENLENSINIFKNKIISSISLIGKEEISPAGEIVRYQKQKEQEFSEGFYIPTGNIGNFNNEIENTEYLKNLPSRAKIKLLTDTLYISKLDGEKKFLYLNSIDNELIVSNGMWGINAEESKKYSLYAYLLSDDFYLNKSALSAGTTMRGINDKSLNKIISSVKIDTKYNNELKKLFNALSEAENLNKSIKKIKEKLINLLIK